MKNFIIVFKFQIRLIKKGASVCDIIHSFSSVVRLNNCILAYVTGWLRSYCLERFPVTTFMPCHELNSPAVKRQWISYMTRSLTVVFDCPTLCSIVNRIIHPRYFTLLITDCSTWHLTEHKSIPFFVCL